MDGNKWIFKMNYALVVGTEPGPDDDAGDDTDVVVGADGAVGVDGVDIDDVSPALLAIAGEFCCAVG